MKVQGEGRLWEFKPYGCLIGAVAANRSAESTEPPKTRHRAVFEHQSVSFTHMRVRAITYFSSLGPGAVLDLEEDRFATLSNTTSKTMDEVDGVMTIKNGRPLPSDAEAETAQNNSSTICRRSRSNGFLNGLYLAGLCSKTLSRPAGGVLSVWNDVSLGEK
jgi:hypothetical protein